MSRITTLAQFCDDLQRTAEELCGMADELTAMFSGNAEKAPAPPEPKPLTLETVRAALAEKSRAGHTAEVRALLDKYGAAKLSELAPEHYAALLAEAEVL
jgi:hypothetical protein